MKLINGTQHPQTQNAQDWAKFGIEFTNPDFRPFSSIDPHKNIRTEALNAWRALLAEMDRNFNGDEIVNGVLLGGYAPITISLYRLLSQMRVPTFCAVMGPAPIVEGQRRQFVLAGCRRIPSPKGVKAAAPIQGQPLPPEVLETSEVEEDAENMPPEYMPEYVTLPSTFEVTRTDRFVYVSSRGLSPEQEAKIAAIAPQKLIATMPVNPPPIEADLSEYQGEINALVKTITETGAPVLLDGAPVETTLRLFALIGHCCPIYFLKTRGTSPQQEFTGVAKVPQF